MTQDREFHNVHTGDAGRKNMGSLLGMVARDGHKVPNVLTVRQDIELGANYLCLAGRRESRVVAAALFAGRMPLSDPRRNEIDCLYKKNSQSGKELILTILRSAHFKKLTWNAAALR